ncbi:MAG: DNA polymerase III subunit delta, partial [Gammaproteobacteria bacterium]
MRLRPEQIEPHLGKGLAPVYLVSGEEPFQLEQISSAIRHKAQELGYTDREVMHVERGFDWQQLSASADALSLFADKRLLELRTKAGGVRKAVS